MEGWLTDKSYFIDGRLYLPRVMLTGKLSTWLLALFHMRWWVCELDVRALYIDLKDDGGI